MQTLNLNIYIQRFVNEKNQIIDHIKGNRAELQKMLGHTTLAMTLHYLRNIIPKEEMGKAYDRTTICRMGAYSVLYSGVKKTI